MAQPLQCRWGVIGTSRTAARFISDLQAADKAKTTSLPIQHTITALTPSPVASHDATTEDVHTFARTFFGDNISRSATPTPSTSAAPVRPVSTLSPTKAFPNGPSAAKSSASSSSASTSTDVKPFIFDSSSDLFATSHVVNAVLIDSLPETQHSLTKDALNAGIAVLLVRPLSLSANDARDLTDLAKTKKTWLAIMMKESKKDKASLRWVADECARCRERNLPESPQVPWEDNIAVLEALDEIRQTGSLPTPEPPYPPNQPSHIEKPEAAPVKEQNGSASHHTAPIPIDAATLAGPSTTAASSSSSSSTAPPAGEPFPPSKEAAEIDVDLAPRRFPRTPRPSGQLPDLTETPEDASDQSVSQESLSERPRRRGQSRPTSRLSITSDGSFAATNDSPKVVHKSLDDPVSSSSGPALRSQIHELKHLLRQKNAQIAALQQQSQSGASGSTSPHPLSVSTGGASQKSAVRISLPVQGLSAPARPPRRRTSSTTTSDASRTPSPLPPRLQPHDSQARTIESPKGQTPEPLGEADINQTSTRQRQSPTESTPPRKTEPLAGFQAPTKASDKRRTMTLMEQANGIAHRQPSNASPSSGQERSTSGHTTQVINHLTTELEAAQSALEATKKKLATAQRNLTTVTKSYESAKDNLYHSRIENDRHVTASARKDRQYTEALERARKAETEAKDLGRASREWGTRVRQVEAELGDVRRQQAKAEAGYEAITSAWKKTRDHWESEVRGLRKQLEDVIAEHREKARSALEKFEAVEHEWKGREGERKGLEAVLEGLKQERTKAKVEVVQIVDDLVKRLETHEELRESQSGQVDEVQSEVRRILRLMRDGVVDPEKIRAK